MIKITDDIFWDETPNAQQSDETMIWISENVYPKIFGNEIKPLLDKWQRPYMWEVLFDTYTVFVERIYKESDKGTWAKKKDTVTIVEGGKK